MNLVLEGPDNSGKTTLAKHLMAGIGNSVTYFHPGGPPPNEEAEEANLKEQFELLTGSTAVLMDRSTCISQAVYSPLQTPSAVTRRQAALSGLLLSGRVMFVYCRPSTDLLMRTDDLTWRPDESEEHKRMIVQNQHTYIERYDALMSKVPCVQMDFQCDEHYDLTKTLTLALGGDEYATRWIKSNLIKEFTKCTSFSR